MLDRVKSLLASIRDATRAEHVLLEPIIIGETIIFPLGKVRVSLGEKILPGDRGPKKGLGQGSGKDPADKPGSDGEPVLMGGGASAFPVAFLILQGETSRLVGFDTFEESLASFLEGEAFTKAVELVRKKMGR